MENEGAESPERQHPMPMEQNDYANGDQQQYAEEGQYQEEMYDPAY